MGLRDQREAPAAQPVYQPQLPEWAPAVERLREDATGEPAQLRVAAGLRQGGVTDMEGETELRVVHPHRTSLLQRHERESLAVPRHEVQPLANCADDVFVGGNRSIEDRTGAHVHMRAGALQVQK